MVETLDANDIFVIDGKNHGGVTRFVLRLPTHAIVTNR